MIRLSKLVIAGALLMYAAPAALAQGTTNSGSSKMDPKLVAAAKITLDSARMIALHAVPHGAVAAEELEREHGRLIYSFDMKVPGKSGIQEVNVNAITGVVVGVHHEGLATERREARADSVAAAKDSSRRIKP